MTTQLDTQIGFKKETTFGEFITPDKFAEFLTEDLDRQPSYAQSASQRPGAIVDRADRRVLVKDEYGGSFTVEGTVKGLGALFEAAFGSGSSNAVPAASGAYQQLFTPVTTDYLPSYTIQKGIPTLGGGAAQPHAFLGCVCSGFELNATNAAVPTLKFNFLGKDLDTATALATASYPAANELLSFTGGSIKIGGTVVVPTTTALASGGTDAANVREVNFTWDNGLDSNGFNLGGGGKRSRKPALGKRTGSGTLTVEYTANTLRDAYLAQTSLALVLEFEYPVALDTGVYPTLQLVLPVIQLEGDLPKANGTDVITQSIGFTLLDGGVAGAPIYVAIVTAESAI